MQGVQRFLSGHKNAIRTAAAMSGPVRPITDAVLQKPVARQGSASAAVSGTYIGAEEALYEFQIVDTTIAIPLTTAPVFSGVGNGDLEDAAAVGLTARSFVVELVDLGQLLTAASTSLQGTTVQVKIPGADGNSYSLRVNRSSLVFTPQSYSLLAELREGTAAVAGPQYDWDTKQMNVDGTVPPDAHRISFGDDKINIYIQYKKLTEGQTSYIFEPPIADTVPAKTVVNFVSGSYTVELYKDVSGTLTLEETYTGIETLYDLLSAIKTQSNLLVVNGPVAYDREEGGQALLELAINTDARVVSNSGSGSSFATGFTDVTIEANSPTELIEATCIAATGEEAANAALGAEMWEVRGSVSGLIRSSVASGDLIHASTFTARIPQKVPDGYTALPHGSFQIRDINYNENKRVFDEATGDFTPPEPPICLDSATLGVNAREQTVTLVYKQRPLDTSSCACTDDNTQVLNPACLGIINPTYGGLMAYSATVQIKLVALYDWFADCVRSNSDYFSDGPHVEQDPFVSQPTLNPNYNVPTQNTFAYISLFKMIEQFEGVIAEIDKLPDGPLKVAGFDAWDTAVTEFEADVDLNLSGPGTVSTIESETFAASEAITTGDALSVFSVSPSTFNIRKARPGDAKFGFAKASFAAAAMATIFYVGENANIVSAGSWASPGPQSQWKWEPSTTTPGHWVKTGTTFTAGDPDSIRDYAMNYVTATNGYMPFGSNKPDSNVVGYALLSDRYTSRLKWVLISAGISPLGKSSANTVSGDGCWQDWGDQFWWEVTGGNGDKYAPAFTGKPYYSAKKYAGGVVVNGMTAPSAGYYTTKEFGFILDIPCAQNLVVGDTITLVIGNAGAPQTYQKGDKLQLGVVAKQNVLFLGGNDGDNIQTWLVTDSVDGPRSSYFLDTDTPAPYDDGSLTFLINQGTLDFAKGDKFTFAVEGGHFRWRKTIAGAVGAWSGATAISGAAQALDSGLSVQFTLGASPAFFPSDAYTFLALQPYALSNIIKPDFDMWQWGTVSPAAATFDLGSVQAIAALGIAYHTIPQGATILLEGGVAAGVYLWSVPVTWQKDVIGTLFPPQDARYLRLTITGGTGGGIGWLYIGPALAFTYSAKVTINRQYSIKRTEATNPSAVFKGKSVGSEIQWPEGFIVEEDYQPLIEMIDWLKSNDDEALMFFPQHTRQGEVVLGTVDSDAITFNDVYDFQPDSGYKRRLSATIPLKGVAFK